jgi:hypothetical protein
MGICSAKSLNLASGKALPWVFHDDGSLGRKETKLLASHFPGCSVIPYHQSEAHASERFSDFPRILEYRKKKRLMLKLLDIGNYTKGDRIVFVDTDILFFKQPKELLEHCYRKKGAAFFNRDPEDAYIFSRETIKACTGVNVLERVNSGLFVIEKSVLDYEKVERWLTQLPMNEPFIMHRIEQTLFAMLASDSAFGVEHLSLVYDVDLKKDVTNSVCKHYVGRIRAGFELEGLRYLSSSHQFLDRWNNFVKIN